jgi:hypothetical protein
MMLHITVVILNYETHDTLDILRMQAQADVDEALGRLRDILQEDTTLPVSMCRLNSGFINGYCIPSGISA